MTDLWAATAAALVLSTAMGLDLYLTLVLLSLAPHAGWILPSGLEALATTLVAGLAAGLWLMETAAERVPAVAAYWHLVQSLARAVAAALMAYLLVTAAGAPPSMLVVAPLTAAATAAVTHLAKLGWFMVSWWSSYDVARKILLSVGEDTVALALVALAVGAPGWGGLGVAGAMLLLVLLWPDLLRAGAYSHYLAWSRSWDSLRPVRWRSEEELSADLAGEVAAIGRPLGHRLRVTPAGGFRVPGIGLFRPGWLVVGPADPRWVCRTLRGPRMVVLDPDGARMAGVEPLFVRVPAGSDSAGTLIFPRGGPNLEAIASGITAGSPPPEVEPGSQDVETAPRPTLGTQN